MGYDWKITAWISNYTPLKIKDVIIHTQISDKLCQ